jgi:amino acid transporter
VSSASGDDDELERLGYKPELARTLDLLASFSIAFSYISPVVGVYTLFGFGLSTGGPAYLWSLPVVVLGQLLVVFVFCELAVSYPLAGALYQWARRLVGPRYGWFVGWIYGWALVITIAAIDLGAAPYLAELLGLPVTRATTCLLAAGLLVAHTLINYEGVRGTAFITKAGLVTEIVATLAIAGALFFGPAPLRPIETLFSRAIPGGLADAPALLAASLAMAWIFFGFESAADVAEEVLDPGRRVPRAMILSLLGAAVVTALLVAALILAAPDLGAAAAQPALAIPMILEARLGPALLKGLLVLLMFAYLSCAGAAQAAAARLTYSYARDGMLPGSAWLRRVSPGHKVPANATLFTAGLALVIVALSYVDLGAVNVNALVVSYAVVGVYLSFQAVVVARLVAAARGWKARTAPGLFSLGRLGTPVAWAALAYGTAMIVNLCWPRPVDSLASWLTLGAALGIVVPGLVIAGTRRFD